MAKVKAIIFGGKKAWVEYRNGSFMLLVAEEDKAWPHIVMSCKTLMEMVDAVDDLRIELYDIWSELKCGNDGFGHFKDFKVNEEATE